MRTRCARAVPSADFWTWGFHVAVVFEGMNMVSFSRIICLEKLSARCLSKAACSPLFRSSKRPWTACDLKGLGPRITAGYKALVIDGPPAVLQIYHHENKKSSLKHNYKL